MAQQMQQHQPCSFMDSPLINSANKKKEKEEDHPFKLETENINFNLLDLGHLKANIVNPPDSTLVSANRSEYLKYLSHMIKLMSDKIFALQK